MDWRQYFVRLYDYNAWANRRLRAAAAGLSAEQLYHSHGHSWDSIHGVLLHMLSSEWVWLQRWQGESPQQLLDPNDFKQLARLDAYWVQLDGELRRFVAAQTEASLGRVVTYRSTHGEPYQAELWQLLAHLANHGTHHRGELAAMFATLAVPHPEDDLVRYFREQSGQLPPT